VYKRSKQLSAPSHPCAKLLWPYLLKAHVILKYLQPAEPDLPCGFGLRGFYSRV